MLADLASSRAYIFWLEALAQVLSLLTVSQMVQNHVMCWIDNTSGEHALNKGYSKDLCLSAVIGSCWTWVASRSMSVSFHRVPSSENLSDGVSRGDLSEVRAVQGQFATVQFREAWGLLSQISSEPHNYADQFEQLFACLGSQLVQYTPEGGFEAR